MRVTMDAAGFLVIPAEMLAEAGWPPDTEFEVSVRDGKIEIEAAVPVGAAAGARERGKGLSLVRGGIAGGGIAGPVSERPRLDLLIRMAIAHHRIVDLVYDDRRRSNRTTTASATASRSSSSISAPAKADPPTPPAGARSGSRRSPTSTSQTKPSRDAAPPTPTGG